VFDEDSGGWERVEDCLGRRCGRGWAAALGRLSCSGLVSAVGTIVPAAVVANPGAGNGDSTRTRDTTMPELIIDFITSLDGHAAADGWPGWWGLEGPEFGGCAWPS
jgi:hypothetical protein